MMVAAGFATMPVERATAVHTTIQGNQGTPFTVVVSDTIAVATVRDFTLNCTTDCIVTGITAQSTAQSATTNIYTVANCEVDAVQVIPVDIAAAGNDLATQEIADVGAEAALDLPLEQLFTGFTVQTGIDLAILATPSAAVDVLGICGHTSRGTWAAGIGPTTAGTRDVVVEINGSVVGAASTVQVTFTGFMVGTTEPAGAAEVNA